MLAFMKILTGLAIAGCLAVLGGLITILLWPRVATRIETYEGLAQAERRPERFEPSLHAHPFDVRRREAAVAWYSGARTDLDRLEEHSLALARAKPDDALLDTCNVASVYRDHPYAERLIGVLESHRARGHREYRLDLTLGRLCERDAIPIQQGSSMSRAECIRRLGIPTGARLRSIPDQEEAQRAVRYFRLALDSAQGGAVRTAAAADDLVRLLSRLGREADAANVCERVLSHETGPYRAELLLKYGRSLYRTGRTAEAVLAFSQVRACDRDGAGGGPGFSTMRAENELGQIALDEGVLPEAGRHLVAACRVGASARMAEGCPVQFAGHLLEAGCPQPVVEYCRTILRDLNPADRRVRLLLRKAELGRNLAATP